MVDFSCALKLSIPIAVLSGMRECHKYRVSVKGGRFLEAVAKADTVVFDKTGTLTYAKPRVAEIVTFGGRAENDMLRLAACLEEHYPHSLANACLLYTSVAYKHILLKPTFGGSFTHANGSYDSVRGKIESGWTLDKESGAFTYHAVVPANTTATLYLPAESAESAVTEGGKPVSESEGVTFRCV